MGRIQTYDNDTNISANDRVIGSDADNGDLTQNYTMGDILSYVQSNITVESPYADNPATPTVETTAGGVLAYFTSVMPANSMAVGDVLKFRLVATTEAGLQATDLQLSVNVLGAFGDTNPIVDPTTSPLTIIVDGYAMLKASNDLEISYVITATGVSYNYSSASRVRVGTTQNLAVDRTFTLGWTRGTGSFDLTVRAASFNLVKQNTD